MLTLCILLICIIIGGFLYMKFKSAKNKRPEERSAVESIMVSASVKGRKNMEETADAIRTVEISKEEGIQKTRDAINQLDLEFKKQIKELMLSQSNLSRNLSELKEQPAKMEGRAKASKKKMQEAMDAGKSETVIALHKKNAIMYLDMKSKVQERIVKVEKILEEIEANLEITQATYENRKVILQDMLQEFKSFTGAISAAKFNDSINIIKSLKEETITKLAIQNAEIKANDFISGTNSETESVDATVSSGKYDEEFEKL